MGATSLTLTYEGILSTTIMKWARTLEDTISTGSPFYYLIKQQGGYTTVTDVGERMQVPLMYELGPTDSYSGWDPLKINAQEGITSAFYTWAQSNTAIAINGKEELQNSGEEKMISLLEAKTTQAEMGAVEFFDKALLRGNGINTATAVTTKYTSPNNGSTFVEPMGLQIAYDPTASLSPGGISQASNLWWRNQKKTSTASTYAGFLKEMRSLRRLLLRGPGGGPNLHLCDEDTYTLYESALAAAHQNPSYEKADIPFDNIAFYKAPVVADQFVIDAAGGSTTQSTTSGTWYQINTKFFRIQAHSSRNFTAGPFIVPYDQDGRVSHVLWFGAVGCGNRRKQGVHGAINTTIAS